MPERPIHRHLGHGRSGTAQQLPPRAIQAPQAQPLRRAHPGVGLETLLQLAQRRADNLRQFQQVDGFIRRIRRPFADARHQLALVTALLQCAAIQAHTGVVEDEQAVVEQLPGEANRVDDRGQARQRATEPAAEQRVLLAGQRGHEQAFQPAHIQAVALYELRPEYHGHFPVVFRRDPGVAALTIEQIQRVVAAIETECQRARRRIEMLLDAGVHALFVHLHPLQVEVTDASGKMPRRHLLVLLYPAGCRPALGGHITGGEGLYAQSGCLCHGKSVRTLLVRCAACKVDRCRL